jgi:hypothetical protein
MGFYLAEGSVIWQYGKAAAMCFSIHSSEVERSNEWLDSFKLYCSSIESHHAHGLCHNILVYGSSFASCLSGRCGYKEEKHFPRYWWEYGDEFIRGLIHGYILGDGHFNKDPNSRIITVSTIRESLAISLRDALASLGYGWASIKFNPANTKGGRNNKNQWIVVLSGPGVNQLARECGKDVIEYQKKSRHGGRNGLTEISEINGQKYAWVRLIKKAKALQQSVYDI